MKRAVVFLNGDGLPKKRVLKFIKKTDFIIAADGGAKQALASGLTPDVVIGDFDSLGTSIQKKLKPPKTNFVTFPKDKDQTDSELAIEYALSQGFKEIIIMGMNGSRLDHMLGSLLFTVHHTKNTLITVIEKVQVIFVVRRKLNIKGRKGDYVSLIPMTAKANGVSTSGLKYPLHNALLPFGKTLGISNELISSTAAISIYNGILLAIHTDEKE